MNPRTKKVRERKLKWMVTDTKKIKKKKQVTEEEMEDGESETEGKGKLETAEEKKVKRKVIGEKKVKRKVIGEKKVKRKVIGKKKVKEKKKVIEEEMEAGESETEDKDKLETDKEKQVSEEEMEEEKSDTEDKNILETDKEKQVSEEEIEEGESETEDNDKLETDKEKQVSEEEMEEGESETEDNDKLETDKEKQVSEEEMEEGESESEDKDKLETDEEKLKLVMEEEESGTEVKEEMEEGESETEEEKNGSENIKTRTEEEKKIKNERIHESDVSLDDSSDDDFDDDMETLQYDSDGSILDEYDKNGTINLSSKNHISLEEKQKLSNLSIRLKHQVPPQHEIEKYAGTRSLNKQEREEFEKYAVLKMGKFEKKEDKILRNNWRDFCTKYDWDLKNPKPFLQMRHKNKIAYISFRDRRKFIQFLANGLSKRSLYSVYNRFKVIYDPHKVSRYSSREDDIIIEFLRHYKISDHERDRKFAELSSILKRTRASVWRRYQVLKKKLNILDNTDDKLLL